MTNTEKIENLINLYETLLEHISNLSKITSTLVDTKNNIKKIRELNEFHKKTREIAKVILTEDLSNLSSNFTFKFLVNKDLTPTSIKFINLVTLYNEKIIEFYDISDDDNLDSMINELHDLNKIAQNTFKSIIKELKRLK